MRRQAEFEADPDEPLGGVILVPLNGVTIVAGELVVEIVVPLTNGDKRGDEMVLGRVLVIEWRLAKPMRK